MSWMKKIYGIIVLVSLILTACAQKFPTWQEEYDLGVHYLSEGNYEEAIIAFTAAIEIDPKQAPAYVGRGDAYIGLGETEENLTAAQADYEQAIELDETNADAYLGLADVYIYRGDYDKAMEILRQGLEKTGGDQSIENKMAEIEQKNDSFQSSDEFVESSVLSQELQDYLVSLIDVFNTDDAESVKDILKEGFPVDGYNMPGGGSINILRTQISGYKVELWDHSNINAEQNRVAYRVQIRPEAGIAYGAEYQHNFSEEHGYESTFYIRGECSDWNWNGNYTYYDYLDSGDWYDKRLENGTMKDCLCDGIVTREIIFSGDNPIVNKQLYEYGKGQPYYNHNGLLQPGSDTYSTGVFMTGGWTTLDEVKASLWWN